MYLSVQMLQKFLAEHPLRQSETDDASLLDLLCIFYNAYYPVEEAQIRTALQTIDPILNTLSRKRKRKLHNTVRVLCAERAQAAFTEGVRFGARLMNELQRD